ncbi:hypothetical protein Golob_017603 [Gossypium lobatum]|uniref:Uncharacterized protein n=1 Tax=Gossypium lobatum TaxID=34289 RepID=A0A7J8M7P8_9ROSI|nr:hypothetical protein [Gossypium lobatum]
MAVDLAPAMPVSWRDKVLRKGSKASVQSVILGEISGLVGKVSKLDFKIGDRTMGHFAQMVVYVNIDKQLIFHIRINTKSGSMDLGIKRVGKAIEKKPINEAGLIVSGLSNVESFKDNSGGVKGIDLSLIPQ